MMKYVIRIYKEKYCFSDYDESIYHVPEMEVDEDDILLEKEAKTIEDIIPIWEDLIEDYEGYTYCVKDIVNDNIIIGGAYDPNDIDALEEYLEEESEDNESEKY